MRIKGSALNARLQYISSEFSDSELNRVLESLNDEDQLVFSAVNKRLDPDTWYPFALSTRLDKAIVDVIGQGDWRFFERLGEAAAKHNLTTIHQHLLVKDNPQAFLQKATEVYHTYRDEGRQQYVVTGPCSGILSTYEVEDASPANCRTIIGWYKEAIRLCGASHVTAIEGNCRARGADHCRCLFFWQMPTESGASKDMHRDERERLMRRGSLAR